MATSIASQLETLKSLVQVDSQPQKRPFTRPSILFDPKEAADIDIETIWSTALQGRLKLSSSFVLNSYLYVKMVNMKTHLLVEVWSFPFLNIVVLCCWQINTNGKSLGAEIWKLDYVQIVMCLNCILYGRLCLPHLINVLKLLSDVVERYACNWTDGMISLCTISGLEVLISSDKQFKNYKNDLFSHRSKDLDRELMGIEENNQINVSISSYLRLLSGFFLLPSALKTLEYLIRRYK